MDNKQTLDTLNTLLETCRDGEYGFRACAEHVDGAILRSVLNERADECAAAARVLMALIAKWGVKGDEGGTVSGALHRGWVSVRSVLSTATDAAMLEECERGEDRALARYREALDSGLPDDIAPLVQQQYNGVKRNHDQIRYLRDRASATS